jgi:hypothetical protein
VTIEGRSHPLRPLIVWGQAASNQCPRDGSMPRGATLAPKLGRARGKLRMLRLLGRPNPPLVTAPQSDAPSAFVNPVQAPNYVTPR